MPNASTGPAATANPARAALYMLGAAVCFAAMNVIIRHLSDELHGLQIVFFRNLFGLIAMLPWVSRVGVASLRTGRLGLIGVRACFGAVAMGAWFTSLSMVPLGTATALSFSAPLFTAVVAVIVLGEVIRARRIAALLAGFVGVLIILRPGATRIGTGELLVIASTVAMAFSIVLVKILTRTESAPKLVVYQTALIAPLSLLPALLVWRWPEPATWLWLIGLGTLASIAHVSFNRAFALADTTFLMPFDYVRLPVTALLAWLFFAEPTDVWTWVGGALIAVSTLYIAQREALAARTQARRPPP